MSGRPKEPPKTRVVGLGDKTEGGQGREPFGYGYRGWGDYRWEGGQGLGEFPRRVAGLTIASWVSLGVSLVLFLLALVFIFAGGLWEMSLMYALLFLVIGNWVFNVEDK